MSVLSLPFLVLGVIVAVFNWLYVLSSIRGANRPRTSLIPFVGGILGTIAIALSPALPTWTWALLFVDPGTIVGIASVPKIVRTALNFSPLNLHAEFSNTQHRLRLYRHGEFLLEFKPEDPSQETTPIMTAAGGAWHETRDHIVLSFSGHVVELLAAADGTELVVCEQDTPAPMKLLQSTRLQRIKSPSPRGSTSTT